MVFSCATPPPTHTPHFPRKKKKTTHLRCCWFECWPVGICPAANRRGSHSHWMARSSSWKTRHEGTTQSPQKHEKTARPIQHHEAGTQSSGAGELYVCEVGGRPTLLSFINILTSKKSESLQKPTCSGSDVFVCLHFVCTRLYNAVVHLVSILLVGLML